MNCRVSLLCLACCLVFCLKSFAQQDVASDKPAVAAPRVLKIADADGWQSVGQFTLSPDGTWSAHTVMPGEGDGQLIIAKTDGSGEIANNDKDAEKGEPEDKGGDKHDAKAKESKHKASNRYKFEVGPGSGQFEFSQDSKFVAFLEAPKDKAAKAAKKSGEPLKNKAILLDLATGEKTEFENAQDFSFSGENPTCLAVSKMKPKGRPEGDKGWDGTDLLIHDLTTKSEINIGNVKSFSFNRSGKILALLIDAEGKSGNGVQLFHVENSRIEPLDNDKANYNSMSWAREGDAFAFLKATKDEKFENERHSLLAFSDVGGPNQKKTLLDPANDPAVPGNMTISPNRNPMWNDDRTAFFFGIHELKPNKDDEKGKADPARGESKPDDAERDKTPSAETEKDETAGLVIWHWNDPRLQSMQQKQESRDKNQSDLCVHIVDKGTSFRLADEEIPDVSVSRPYKFAIGSDDQKYERMGNLEGNRYRDVYTIDLKSGKRKLVLEKAQYVFDVSTNGEDLLYYKDEGHFYVYNMTSGTHTNITASAGTSFVDSDDDHNVVNPPQRPVGWTTEGGHVLLNDGWDIWKVSVTGDEATNLTVNGRAEQIRYSSPRRFDLDIEGVDFSKPVYLSAYGEWTKKSGFARINPGAAGVEMLLWDDASFGSLDKLKDHEIYSYSRSTHQEPTSYLVGGPDLKEFRQVADSNKQLQDFKWSAGVKLVEYTDSKGNKLQGALHLPADYIEGKRYPTIVYMYEKLSQNANRFDSPRTGGFSESVYTSNGYAVFNPDIIFQINDPGLSSKDCILAGLDAAIASGVVDPEHVGLHGHSWGGYQTAFLITQTDRFKAAVAGAPLTNMISMYSSIYWNSGSANQPIFETSQGRFKGGYWDNLDAYARNSPVYYADKVVTPLVLLHNDADGACAPRESTSSQWSKRQDENHAFVARL